jgi:hypothetical protein
MSDSTAEAARREVETCDNDSANCEYTRSNCEADGSFICAVHPNSPFVPAPSTAVPVGAVEAARTVLNKYRKRRWHINGTIVEEALLAALPHLQVWWEARNTQVQVTEEMGLAFWREWDFLGNGTHRRTELAIAAALEKRET